MSARAAVGRTLPGRPDFVIVAVVLVLTGIGLVLVYSASFAIGLNDYGNTNYFVYRQVGGAVLGLTLMAGLARLDYRRLSRPSPLLLLAAVAGLALVLLPAIAHASNGATRWIRLGPLPPVQPSEFAKLAMVVYIAAWLAAKGDQVRRFALGVVPFVMMVGLIGGLIMLQPDLGTFAVIVLTTGTMFFVAGASLSHLVTLCAAGAACGAVLVLAEGYRLERVTAYLHAEKDPAGKGFQILQLLIALGSGGVRGLGLGESRQKFFYVPGAHTDGIFAIAGEELGFIGAVIIIALFAVLVARGFLAAQRARDEFGYLLAVGVTCWIAFQAAINIGGITRSVPLTGIPLPFLSYGSSALVATLAAVGVLLSVSRYRNDEGYLQRHRAAPPHAGRSARRSRRARPAPVPRPALITGGPALDERSAAPARDGAVFRRRTAGTHPPPAGAGAGTAVRAALLDEWPAPPRWEGLVRAAPVARPGQRGPDAEGGAHRPWGRA
jgi:cell division protein FtsW